MPPHTEHFSCQDPATLAAGQNALRRLDMQRLWVRAEPPNAPECLSQRSTAGHRPSEEKSLNLRAPLKILKWLPR
jgi:hypothetical protein